jgi:hypothetical protein
MDANGSKATNYFILKSGGAEDLIGAEKGLFSRIYGY